MSSGLSQTSVKLNVIPLKKIPEDLEIEARRVGAAYIIDGNVQSVGDALRVTVNLRDTEYLSIVWSDTFKRNLGSSDLFAIQDEIVSDVVETLVGNGAILRKDVIDRVKQKGPENLSVYECRNYAYQFYDTLLPTDFESATTCLKKSIIEDPNYADIHAHLAAIYAVGWNFAYFSDRNLLLQAVGYADRAISLDPNSWRAHISRGRLMFAMRDWKNMYQSFSHAEKLAPNNVEVLSLGGDMTFWGGRCTLEEYSDTKAAPDTYVSGLCRWQVGWERLLKAHRLDKGNHFVGKHYGLATGFNMRGDYQTAYNHMRMAQAPGFLWYEIHAGIAADGLGKNMEAQKHFDSLKKSISSDRLADVLEHYKFWNVVESYWSKSKPILLKYGFM